MLSASHMSTGDECCHVMPVQGVTPGTASLCAASSSFGSPVDKDTDDTVEASEGFRSSAATDTAAAAVANTSSLAASGCSEGGEHADTVSEEAAPPHCHAVSANADDTGVLSAIDWCYLP